MGRLRGWAGIPVVGALALALWLLWGHGFANYDALYSLVWGRELADGHGPSFDVPLAPTPHPLANLAGLALSPFSPRASEDVLVVVAFLALGAVGWLVYALGARWFGAAAGVLAAVLFLTREPVLSYGTRAYVDLPYLALVLGALLVVERRRAPFALLALAGLLRPEAWLFSVALAGWRWWRDGTWSWELAALAAAAPVLWLLGDLAATGDPLHSLTGTRENVVTLGRKTGLANVPLYLPRRVGEVLREPVLAGAVVGAALTARFLPRRALLPAAAGALAVGAFVVLAAAGLPIITRYTFAVDAILVAFCAAGAFGWLALPDGHPWRMRWAALGVLVLVLQVAYAPAQARRLDRTRDAIALQDTIEDDLWTVALPLCPNGRRVGAVNHRLVPLLALRLDQAPGRIRAAPLPRGFLGTYVEPATPLTARAFVLDPRDPSQEVQAPPRGLATVAESTWWRVRQRCTPPVRGGE
jgi:biotin transporter BioY